MDFITAFHYLNFVLVLCALIFHSEDPNGVKHLNEYSPEDDNDN